MIPDLVFALERRLAVAHCIKNNMDPTNRAFGITKPDERQAYGNRIQGTRFLTYQFVGPMPVEYDEIEGDTQCGIALRAVDAVPYAPLA